MIFAVFASSKPQALGAAIVKHYPGDHFELQPGQWLVADTGTAKDVSDKLGITSGTNGSALVVGVTGYFGRKSANIWEWIKAKMVQADNA